MLNKKQIFHLEQIIQNCKDRYDINWDNLTKWCHPMSMAKYKQLVHPVYYNGVELPHHYYMIQGLLYRQCEGAFIPVPVYPNNRGRGNMQYKIRVGEQKKSLQLGGLIKSNYIVPKDWHIHHLDGDKFNNVAENLVMLDPAIHNSHHGARLKIKAQKSKFFSQFAD